MPAVGRVACLAAALVGFAVLASRLAGVLAGSVPAPVTLAAVRAATPASGQAAEPAIALVKVAAGLADPVAVAAPDDGSGRLFVVERFGRIRVVDAKGNLLREPFLDLGSRVATAGAEQGLLGLAFHPNFRENGRFYIAFTELNTNGDTFIMEYQVDPADPNRADMGSGRLLLAVDQPYWDHNGGTLQFGPDGYLYIGMGDGGNAGDPYDNAQDRSTLLGKILRVDVDGADGAPYAIPADNPFVAGERSDSPFLPAHDRAAPARERSRVARKAQLPRVTISTGKLNEEARPEIWVYGLRNPWQFSFDAATGDLYIPDVGQRAWEEVNVLPADSRGGVNYGWDWLEGTHCYPETLERCPRQQIGELPVVEYAHGDDGCAVAGIGVYRGTAIPSLDGTYLYGDWCSGKIWGLRHDGDGAWSNRELFDATFQINGGGADAAGDLYVVGGEGQVPRYTDPFANAVGTLWRVVAADHVPAGAETAAAEPAGATPAAPRRSEATATP